MENSLKKYGVRFVVASAALLPLASFATDPDVGASMTTIQTTVIGYIGLAGAAGVAIMAVGLGWDVGMSLIKKFTKKGAR